jgi:SAM-dependent methyltransferase
MDKRSLFGTPVAAVFCAFRRIEFLRQVPWVRRLGKWLVKTAGGEREALYSADYYRYVDECASRSAPGIAHSICAEFSPSRVLDLGCGSGALLAEFRSKNVQGSGLEYSPMGLKACQKKGLNVQRFNIEAVTDRPAGFDLACSFEVAEHVSAEHADTLVDLLTGAAPIVVFTAATPGQGGIDHVNEQPHEYWIERFEKRGFRFQSAISDRWRREWAANAVEWFYIRNAMVFREES